MRKIISILGSLIFLNIVLSFLIPGSMAATSAGLATKDAYVDSFSPTSNYGGTDWLIFGDYILTPAEAYIGFDTSSPPSGWTKAEIEIDMYSISQTTQLTVSLVTTSWNELTITWLNKPAHTQQITTLTVSAMRIYAIDVTNFISGNSLSICINATSLPTGYVQAASREGHDGYIFDGPQIKWTYPDPPEASIPGFISLILVGTMIGTCVYIFKKFKRNSDPK